MNLTTPLTIEHERQVVKRLLDLIADRARREQELESRHASEIAEEQKQYKQVFQLLSETYDAEISTCQQSKVREQADIQERWEAESTSVQRQFDQTLEEINNRWQGTKDAAQKEYDETNWLLASLLDEDTEDSPRARLQAMQTGMAASRTELELAVSSLDGWYRTTTAFLQRCRLLGESALPDPSALPLDLTGLHKTCVESMRQADPIQKRLMGRILPRLFRGIWPLLIFILCSGAVSGLIWLLVPPSVIGLRIDAAARDWALIAAGAGSAIGLIFMFLLHLYAGHQSILDYEKLMQLAVDGDVACERWIVVARRECEEQEAELLRVHEARERQRESALAQAKSKFESQISAANSRYESESQAAQTSFPARLAEIDRVRKLESEQTEARFAAVQHDLLLRRERDFRHLQSEYDQRVGQSRQVYQQGWGQLIRDWHGGLQEAGIAADALCDELKKRCPDWSTVLGGWLESQLQTDEATDATSVLSAGKISIDLQAIPDGLSPDPRLKVERNRFEIPVLLQLAERPSLIVRSRSDARGDAANLLQASMLRFLTSLPPGKVRFTIFDPIGLGANFASFMHLSDIDEQLVTSRIWTEPTHIEKRLGDLTEHMENVLQTYLRNEYSSLDDYNRDAGEVAEPYRILVVANFPANFTEVSLRRLVSIAEGGVKCGVFMLISVDETQSLPRGFSLTDLERHAVVLRQGSDPIGPTTNVLQDLNLSPTSLLEPVVQDRLKPELPQTKQEPSQFRLADPVLGHWPLMLDTPPNADEFGQIVRRAGQLARAVRRVEVPFERVMPAEDRFWTSSTQTGFDIPVGRAGATKLQHLRLGKGTSQHVLIAGKTGSGKSTLLHALITNAALHYSPDEVEFYLIDFKKGVEFKTYATNGLPHARVIAIESDREFGVSVLQRLDALLKDRGEQFRREGVQDLAAYREARPDQPMPRVLLVIDEFQEFFTEDDALSQSAALLFDRLIRQGRSFGVHVLLGSQTLAGAYSLARSTLGQIAVRIALQCSDTDAHLILSEDNTAARLLSRPGEAIYNDANGLVEGNHPFQVVWLEDAQRETYLSWMRQWAQEYQARAGFDSRWPNAVVFEGNVPADATMNSGFADAVTTLIQRERAIKRPQKATRTFWLGESVALTGATRLEYGPRDGGPLLVVGHDEDAALGLLSNGVLGLAGQGPARFVVLDGSLPDSPSARTWGHLARLIPDMKVFSPRDSATALQAIVDDMQTRDDSAAVPVFIVAFDLGRFRDLRKADDDYGGFGGFDKPKTASPAALFAQIVKDGPAISVFPLVWCDGYQSAQRWLGRELLNRFEVRVLMAMNSNDSSNLIDSPAAGRLGPNRALLFRGDMGTLDKFRPYKAPSLGWLEELAQQSAQSGAETTTAASDSHASGETTNGVSSPLPSPLPAAESADTWTDIGELNVS